MSGEVDCVYKTFLISWLEPGNLTTAETFFLQYSDSLFSTGGLIALGLASRDWTVQECIYHFTELCEKAFTRRIGISIPGMSMIIESLHQSKYKTAPLQKALQQAFSEDDYLFGGPRMTNHRTKVAVTATNSGTVSVLANYNRVCVDKRKLPSTLKAPTDSGPVPYYFQRPEKLSSELKIWEA
jgi:hypothetical protein